jgi:D-alanyl-D-alanine carboxypeptidase
VDGIVMRPYHSEHQTGRALDLSKPVGCLVEGSSPVVEWIASNVHYYGFIVRYKYNTTHITGIIHEPWHITYVGREISMYMLDNNILSLEEFVGRNPGVSL